MEDADFIRVLSFDFSKAFDSVPHNVVTEKLKQTNLNPYIINWIISFLTNRKQRVVVDGFITEYANINRGVPQGTVIGPFLFSLMVEDIKPKQPETNKLIKFANDDYIKFLYYSNKFVNIVNLNIYILITYNHVKTHVCCVWRSFKIKTIIIIIIIIIKYV